MNVAEKTVKYIKEHPNIKHCMREGLINYSSLARKIVKDMHMDEKISKESITIAARRYNESTDHEQDNENNIREIISEYEIEIKSRICIIIIDKNPTINIIEDIQKKIHDENGTIYFLEGTDFYKIITEDKYRNMITEKIPKNIIKLTEDTVMIKMKSPEDNESKPGVIAYISGLFAENDIPIIDFISCWTDTYIIIESKNLKKAVEFLKF